MAPIRPGISLSLTNLRLATWVFSPKRLTVRSISWCRLKLNLEMWTVFRFHQHYRPPRATTHKCTRARSPLTLSILWTWSQRMCCSTSCRVNRVQDSFASVIVTSSSRWMKRWKCSQISDGWRWDRLRSLCILTIWWIWILAQCCLVSIILTILHLSPILTISQTLAVICWSQHAQQRVSIQWGRFFRGFLASNPVTTSL